MELEFHAGFPLFVGHFEEIDLGDRPRDIQERIDSTHSVFFTDHGFDFQAGMEAAS
jgi:hypothetical protein